MIFRFVRFWCFTACVLAAACQDVKRDTFTADFGTWSDSLGRTCSQPSRGRCAAANGSESTRARRQRPCPALLHTARPRKECQRRPSAKLWLCVRRYMLPRASTNGEVRQSQEHCDCRTAHATLGTAAPRVHICAWAPVMTLLRTDRLVLAASLMRQGDRKSATIYQPYV